MAQYDVVRLEPEELALDVQTDLLGYFDTRLVVPLLSPEVAPVAHHRLNPTFEIDGKRYVMATQFATTVATASLSRPLANLTHEYDRIRSALDMILLGF